MFSMKQTVLGTRRWFLSLMGASFALIAKAGENQEAANKSDDKAPRDARQRSVKNLQELMTALWSYHEVNDHFPPARIYDKSGKPLLSWRVLLLPYLEQDDLFAQFHLDEPWDSPHNKPLLAKMPKLYAPPLPDKTKEKYATFYQVFVGKGTIFEGREGMSGADITDGTSCTISIVEAAEAVPWTKPADLPYDAKKPLPKLGGLFDGGFHASLADGSARFISSKVSEQTLRGAITRNGGEVLGPDF